MPIPTSADGRETKSMPLSYLVRAAIIASTKDRLLEHPDSFEQGKRAATQGIPAEENPHTAGSSDHAMWKNGHELVAGEIEAGEQEG